MVFCNMNNFEQQNIQKKYVTFGLYMAKFYTLQILAVVEIE